MAKRKYSLRLTSLLGSIVVLLAVVQQVERILTLNKMLSHDVKQTEGLIFQAPPPLPKLQQMPQSLVEALDLIMNERVAAGHRATFVQIGANDGIMNDPLYGAFVNRENLKEDLRKHWIGLQVEPQKELFDQLFNINAPADWCYYNGVVVEGVGNRSEAQVSASSIAYCAGGTVQFCETTTPGVGNENTQGQMNTVNTDWCDVNHGHAAQFGMHLVLHPCVSTYPELLEKAASPDFKRRPLDFLQIDVEGQDYAVIQLFLKDVRPLCIHYEHVHLYENGVGEAAEKVLESAGYTVLQVHSFDTLACLVAGQETASTHKKHSHVEQTEGLIFQAPPPLPKLQRMPQSLVEALDLIMNERVAAGHRATFVQIGANDGIMNDPLYGAFVNRENLKEDLRKHWIGLQVEPQKELFDQLFNINAPADWCYYNGVVVEGVGNRSEAQVSASNIAYCAGGTVQFCETTTPGVGNENTQGQMNTVNTDWCDVNHGHAAQFGMHLVLHPCVSTYPELLEKAASPDFKRRPLDFLQIDVEGQDYAVIQLFLKDVRPLCIHYEHVHLYENGVGEAAEKVLESAGYTVLQVHSFDTLACLVAGQETASTHKKHSHVEQTEGLIFQAPPPLPKLQRMPQSLVEALDLIMNERVAAGHRATFVQIGANDGIMNDPLYGAFVNRENLKEDLRKHWIGLQVEPQKELFDQLFNINAPADWCYYNGVVVEGVGNRSEAQVSASNIAYCAGGTVQFCETTTPGVGNENTQGQMNTVNTDWCDVNHGHAAQFGMHLVLHPCVSTYPELLEKAASPDFKRRPLDFLQIDVEGQDYAVIQLFLKDVRPLCIHYEHVHLYQYGDREAAANFLESIGYTLLQVNSFDTLACLVESNDGRS